VTRGFEHTTHTVEDYTARLSDYTIVATLVTDEPVGTGDADGASIIGFLMAAVYISDGYRPISRVGLGAVGWAIQGLANASCAWRNSMCIPHTDRGVPVMRWLSLCWRGPKRMG